MKTYQDLEKVLKQPRELLDFLLTVISDYKSSDMYVWAVDGDNYARQKNTTIMRYQKLLYTMTGKAVPDNFSANHKCASNFFSRFIIQENQYLLGNGVTFNDKSTKDKLGKNFDNRLQRAAVPIRLSEKKRDVLLSAGASVNCRTGGRGYFQERIRRGIL